MEFFTEIVIGLVSVLNVLYNVTVETQVVHARISVRYFPCYFESCVGETNMYARHSFSSCHVLLILESRIVIPSAIQGEVPYFSWWTIVLLKLFSKSIPPF